MTKTTLRIANPAPFRARRCRRFAILGVVAFLLATCGRPPDLIGIKNTAIPAGSVPDLAQHRIFIVSTRRASEVMGAFYSSGRGSDLSLASADVTVPPNHATGQLERPRHLPPDPPVWFSVIHPVLFRSRASFMAGINRALATRPPGHRKVLLFIHGYNTTTSDAILRRELDSEVAVALARPDAAKAHLAATYIRAPVAGQLGEVSVRAGQYVVPCSSLMPMVPQSRWIIANFKESQIAGLLQGQRVTIQIDALGGLRLTGRITRISPAAGSKFSVLKPDNATGNFVKVP